MNFSKLLKFFFTLVLIFSYQVSFSQYSKSHYIPPVTSTGNGAANAEVQYIYISTPSENPISVTIFPMGGDPVTNNTVSNSNPWEYYIGNGTNTNLMIRTITLMDRLLTIKDLLSNLKTLLMFL